MLTEERRATIAANQALLKSTEDHIRIKQLRINKLKNLNDFKKCDEVSSELRELLKEKGRIESQLAVLNRKDSKLQWYNKKKSKRNKTSAVTTEEYIRSHRTLPELLERQQSASSNKDSDESGDTLIVEDSSPESQPDSQMPTLLVETPSNSPVGASETPDCTQDF